MISAQLRAILEKHLKETADFTVSHSIDDSTQFYEDLFEHYLNNGEMPYGVAKAREGDPLPWLEQKLASDLGIAR